MIRTIAAALAAFVLASFGAFAQGTATPPDTSGTAAKTDTKSDTTGTKSKKHKKAKKAKKSDTSSAKSDTAATPK